MGKELASDHYDKVYAQGGSEQIYVLPYDRSGYFPLHRRVWQLVKAKRCASVLEVGCGSGSFGHLMLDRSPEVAYRGFDFSAVAVERARTRCGTPDRFFVADARATENYVPATDAIVCTEVLEHIEADREVVSMWPAGAYCICSVPNFDAPDHVRHFISEESVRQRYGDLIDIEGIERIKKPVLTDIGLGSRLRALRWNRYRPAMLVALLGLAPFDEVGGWHVFWGRRAA